MLQFLTDHGSTTSFCSNFHKELQKALYSYLKSRGISEDVTNFLHAYMINKECHEYLSWLGQLKSLIKS
jgi:complement component 1 Q subcomponent-binding protein, mitochondrial